MPFRGVYCLLFSVCGILQVGPAAISATIMFIKRGIMMSRKLIHRRRLGFETLEDRQMLAGNVTMQWSGDNLTLAGDGYSNRVYVYDSGSSVTVQGLETRLDGTINGTQNVGRIHNLTILMGRGNDVVVIENVGADAFFDPDGTPQELTGRIVVRGGYGRDQIYVRSPRDIDTEINGLSIFGGPARPCRVGRSISFKHSRRCGSLHQSRRG